jgi:hypothetical protein
LSPNVLKPNKRLHNIHKSRSSQAKEKNEKLFFKFGARMKDFESVLPLRRQLDPDADSKHPFPLTFFLPPPPIRPKHSAHPLKPAKEP